MFRFIARRFVNYLILVFVAASLAYLLASSTLNPIANYLHGGHVNLAAVHSTLRGFNVDPGTPVLSRYWHWLTRIVLHGDFGKSLPGGESVISDMGAARLE